MFSVVSVHVNMGYGGLIDVRISGSRGQQGHYCRDVFPSHAVAACPMSRLGRFRFQQTVCPSRASLRSDHK